MYDHEDFVAMMVKERMNDAMRLAEYRRALGLARQPRASVRVRLGRILIRFGQWLMGESSPSAGSSVRLRQAQS